MNVNLNLLRGFELWCDGKRVALPLSAQRVIAFLALHERPVLRVYAAGTLWLDVPEERSYANLRAAIWRLRQTGHPLVDATARHVAVADDIDIDARRIIAASRAALDDPDNASYVRDDTLFRDLLPD